MEDFQSKLDDFLPAAAKLAETTAAGESGKSRQQFMATGGTCKACHDEYKSQDYFVMNVLSVAARSLGGDCHQAPRGYRK